MTRLLKILLIVFAILAVLAAVAFLNREKIFQTFFKPTDTFLPKGASVDDQKVKNENSEKKNIEVVAIDLDIPWEIAFLPDGEMLVTERSGTLLKIGKDKKSYPIKGVKHRGEGGLLGLALHPKFSDNHWIYLYLTVEENKVLKNRVERYVYKNDSLSERTVILENIPGATNHDGGRIAFSPAKASATAGKPDFYLYITTGDASNGNLSQDIKSLAGKILRVKDDGSIPADNPFGTAVYSYGHRNSQGLAWDDKGNLWATEHGRSGASSGLDELNFIEIGKNYGWPTIEGDEGKNGMEMPVINSGPDETWAPAGAAFLPARRSLGEGGAGSIFFGGLRGEALYEAKITGDKKVSLKIHFHQEFGRIRAVVLGSDSYLYISTSNTDGRGDSKPNDDKIIKINPSIFQKEAEKISEPSVSALIFGDVMLDRYVRTTIQKKGLEYIFLPINKVFLGSDLVLANLEGSFTDFAPNPDVDSLKFTFDPKLIPELKKIGFNIFNLANNHALDFGSAGFAQSKEYLKKNNFDYFGNPKNTTEISIIKNIQGLKIGFIGFNGLIGKIDPVLEEIKKIKGETDIVAIYTHWGAEYNENFTKTQQDQARKLIDAGADVIFGSHPHVVEPIEEYKGKIIFYSLGNFVFDQMFSDETQQELAIGAVFEKESMEYYLFPMESKDIQVNLLSGDKKDIILKELADKSEVSDKIREQIINGKILIE